jgi:hypothetical protein
MEIRDLLEYTLTIIPYTDVPYMVQSMYSKAFETFNNLVIVPDQQRCPESLGRLPSADGMTCVGTAKMGSLLGSPGGERCHHHHTLSSAIGCRLIHCDELPCP